MKLKGPEDKRAKRLSLVLEPDHLLPLERYQAYYRDTYGEEIDFGEMIVQLAAVTIDADRAFKRWKRENSRNAAA